MFSVLFPNPKGTDVFGFQIHQEFGCSRLSFWIRKARVFSAFVRIHSSGDLGSISEIRKARLFSAFVRIHSSGDLGSLSRIGKALVFSALLRSHRVPHDHISKTVHPNARSNNHVDQPTRIAKPAAGHRPTSSRRHHTWRSPFRVRIDYDESRKTQPSHGLRPSVAPALCASRQPHARTARSIHAETTLPHTRPVNIFCNIFCK